MQQAGSRGNLSWRWHSSSGSLSFVSLGLGAAINTQQSLDLGSCFGYNNSPLQLAGVQEEHMPAAPAAQLEGMTFLLL